MTDPALVNKSDFRRNRIMDVIDKAICTQQESTNDGGAALQTVQKFMEALLRQSQTLNSTMLNHVRELVEHAPTIDEWDTIFRVIDKEKNPAVYAMMLERRRHIDQFWVSVEALVYTHTIHLEGLDPSKDLLPDDVYAAVGGENRMP